MVDFLEELTEQLDEQWRSGTRSEQTDEDFQQDIFAQKHTELLMSNPEYYAVIKQCAEESVDVWIELMAANNDKPEHERLPLDDIHKLWMDKLPKIDAKYQPRLDQLEKEILK
jgi:hypothetical protein